MRRLANSFLVFLLLMGSVAFAQAADLDLGTYSVEGYGAWTVERADGLDTLSSQDGSNRKVFISVKQAGKDADIDALAREMVGQTPYTILEGGKSFVYKDAVGVRGWYILTSDGTLVGISTEGSYDGAGIFLGSLIPADGQNALQEAFTAAADDDNVTRWLRGYRLATDSDEKIPGWWGDYCAGDNCFAISNFREGPEEFYFMFSFTAKGTETGSGLAIVEGREAAGDGLTFTLSADDNTLTVSPDPETQAEAGADWATNCAGTYTRTE